MTLQRDVFIDYINQAADNDKDIFFLSADFGAKALDNFRAKHPDQFLHCGISEQHMIDMAAGLSLAGKKVYVYAMGPFFLRCYEQIKCLAMMNLPVTMISTGVGLGYADSGPTHYLTEDIACFRALNGIEILTPADPLCTLAAAKQSLADPVLRYIRLDREPLPSFDRGKYHYLEEGVNKLARDGFHEFVTGSGVCILSSGYMLHRCLEACKQLEVRPTVISLFRIKPISDSLGDVIMRHDAVLTVEEQCLSGGFGSAVLEVMSDNNIHIPVKRMGLPDRYYFENGGRAMLLDKFGLSVDDICSAVKEFQNI